jgi:hypothetical protein
MTTDRKPSRWRQSESRIEEATFGPSERLDPLAMTDQIAVSRMPRAVVKDVVLSVVVSSAGPVSSQRGRACRSAWWRRYHRRRRSRSGCAIVAIRGGESFAGTPLRGEMTSADSLGSIETLGAPPLVVADTLKNQGVVERDGASDVTLESSSALGGDADAVRAARSLTRR